MEKLSLSFIDMSLVSFAELMSVKSASSHVFTKLITLSSQAWSIISAEFWWDEVYSLILFWSFIPSLILTLDYVYINSCKLISVWNELKFWTLLWKFDVTITLSLFDVFKWFDLLLLTCEILVLRIQFLDLEKKSCHVFFLTTYTP